MRNLFMRRIGYLIAWALVSILSISSACAEVYNTDQYFPLDVGKYWIYDGASTTFVGESSQTKYASTVTTVQPGQVFNGVQTTLLDDDERALLGMPTARNMWYFARSVDGTILYFNDQGESTCTRPYNPPVVFLPSMVTEGETFTSSTTMTCKDMKVVIERLAQVLNVEKIQVPGGKFDALKIVEKIKIIFPDLPTPNTQREEHFSWFAKNVGEVKRQWNNYNATDALVHRGELSLAASDLIQQADEEKDDGCSIDCATGNPINYGTGNKFQIEVDYEGTGSFPLRFQRSYNSRVPVTTFLGNNWRHNYDSRLTPVFGVSSAKVRMKRADGKAYTFSRQGNGVWTADADINDKLEAVATDASGTVTTWQYTTARDTVETYDQVGKLISIRNRAGLVHTLTYLPANSTRLYMVADSFGRKLTFNYDPTTGQLAGVVDPDGQIIKFSRDGGGNLTQVVYQDGKVRNYKYNEQVYTGGVNLPYALTSIVDENQAVYAIWHYDDSGRAISSEHAGGAEKVAISYAENGVVTITDGLEKARTFSVQKVLNVSKTTGVSEFCSTCTDGVTAAKAYDSHGNVVSRTSFNGNKACYGYDLTRNLETARVEGLPSNADCAASLSASSLATPTRKIVTEWHPNFRLPIRTAEPKRITTNAYDAKGNLTEKRIQATSDANGAQGFNAAAVGSAQVWSYTYNDVGLMLSATDPRNNTTTYTYDNRGNLTSATNASGHATTLTNYDANGRVGRIVDPNGLTTDLSYSPRGWLTSKKTGEEMTRYDYDGVGQLTKVTLADGSHVTYTYDDAHRLTAIVDSLGNGIVYTLDPMGNRVSEQVRDPEGALTRQTTRVYDALNRLQQITGAIQ
jgi:YD repeat-containing protein